MDVMQLRRNLLMQGDGDSVKMKTGSFTTTEKIFEKIIDLGIDHSRVKHILLYLDSNEETFTGANYVSSMCCITLPQYALTPYAEVIPYYHAYININSSGLIVSGTVGRSSYSSGPTSPTGYDNYWTFRGSNSFIGFRENSTYVWEAYYE